MSKLYSSKDVEHVLKKLNFFLISQKGSHGKYKNPSGRIGSAEVRKLGSAEARKLRSAEVRK